MNQYVDNKIVLAPYTRALENALLGFLSYKNAYKAPAASVMYLESTREPVEVISLRTLEAEVRQREAAEAEFEAYVETFAQYMRNFITPKGADITPEVEKEFFVLRNNCLYTVEELAAVRDRYLNPLNPTILHAVEDYANQKLWSGFSFATDAERYMNAIEKAKELAPAAFADLDSNEAQALAQHANVATFIAYANGENVG